MNSNEILSYSVIYSINNFPIGDVPQNMNEVQAKIAVVSNVLSKLNYEDVELSETLKSEDIDQREMNYRTVISHAYALDINDLPPLSLAIKYVGTSLEFITDYNKIAYCSKNNDEYKRTYELVNAYALNIYEKEEQKHI